MDIEAESKSNRQSESGSSGSGSSNSYSGSGSGSSSGSNNSNSVSRSSASKSSATNSRSGSENSRSVSPSQSRSGSENSKFASRSGSESGSSVSRSSASSRSRSASEDSKSSRKDEKLKPVEEVMPKVEEAKPVVEEQKPNENKPVEEEKIEVEENETKPIVEESLAIEEETIPIEQPMPIIEDVKPVESNPMEEIKVEEEEVKPNLEEVKPVEEPVKIKEELKPVEEVKPVENEDVKPVETKPMEETKEEDVKPVVEEELKLDKKVSDKYLNILKSLRLNYDKDINGLKMKIKDHTLVEYLTLIIQSNMFYASYTESINTIINKLSIVGNEINLNFIDETIDSIKKFQSEEEINNTIENIKNHYKCLKDCQDLLIQVINKLLGDINNLKQLNDSKSIEDTITKWNNSYNNNNNNNNNKSDGDENNDDNNNSNKVYISIDKYYEFIYEFIEYLSKIFLSEPPPPPIPNLDYDEFCFKEDEFVNIYHYQSKQYRVARIYAISNGIYTVKYLSETILKFKANLLYPVLKPQDNVIFHLPADSTPYDGIVVSNMHNNNYWILAKNRRRYYVPIDHITTDKRNDIGSEVKVFYLDKYRHGVIISIEYDMRDTYYMIRLYEENEDLLPDRLEKCKSILKYHDN